MEADEIIVSEEANAVVWTSRLHFQTLSAGLFGQSYPVQADRLLGGNPGGDSERVEQFFNQAAHIHGRGLGFSSERSSRGEQTPCYSARAVLTLLALFTNHACYGNQAVGPVLNWVDWIEARVTTP